MNDGASFARHQVRELVAALGRLDQPPFPDLLATVADRVTSCLAGGGRVLFCGNGGSAADAQHLAAELVGRQNYDRPPAAGIALTVDTSALTAVANDYGYDQVFARQVRALGRPGDVLFAISTSGRSANVVAAVAAAREMDITTVAFTGAEPRDLGSADLVVAVPAGDTAKIQELHICCGHIVFALTERALHPRPAGV
jgi:D-sedoheptulose 7-phosphate isomerase